MKVNLKDRRWNKVGKLLNEVQESARAYGWSSDQGRRSEAARDKEAMDQAHKQLVEYIQGLFNQIDKLKVRDDQ